MSERPLFIAAPKGPCPEIRHRHRYETVPAFRQHSGLRTLYFCQKDLFSCCDASNPNAAMAAEVMGQSPAGLLGFSHMLGDFLVDKRNSCGSLMPTSVSSKIRKAFPMNRCYFCRISSPLATRQRKIAVSSQAPSSALVGGAETSK